MQLQISQRCQGFLLFFISFYCSFFTRGLWLTRKCGVNANSPAVSKKSQQSWTLGCQLKEDTNHLVCIWKLRCRMCPWVRSATCWIDDCLPFHDSGQRGVGGVVKAMPWPLSGSPQPKENQLLTNCAAYLYLKKTCIVKSFMNDASLVFTPTDVFCLLSIDS